MLSHFPEIEYLPLKELNGDKDCILLTNTHTQLSHLPPTVLKKTKLIIHPNSGYDHFTQDHNLWKDIPVVIGHEIRAQAVAEYSIGCLFEGAMELPQHLSWNKERRWDRKLLKGKTVLIFGYGHIGKIIAGTLYTLGLEVQIVDPYIDHCPFPLYKTWRETKLQDVDVVIACMGLNSTTKKYFNVEFFNHAKDSLLFINGARGGLVNEVSLRDFLQKNPKAFAFLDVFEREPFGEEWHHFPQIWKTSHIAGVHKDLDEGILSFEKKVLGDFLHLSENEFKQKYQHELLQNKWRQGELI